MGLKKLKRTRLICLPLGAELVTRKTGRKQSNQVSDVESQSNFYLSFVYLS